MAVTWKKLAYDKDIVRQITITVENPTATENICIGFTFVPITVTEVQAVLKGTANGQSVTIEPVHGTDRSTATNDILDAPTAITSLTTGSNLTSFDDATIPADSYIVLTTTAKAGTVTELTMAIRYTVD